MILILSDSQYKGWQPEKDDLFDIQIGQLCFVDKYGRLSLKEARWFDKEEDEGTDSYDSTSFENTPSPSSVPSVERSTPGSSSIYPTTEDPDGIEELTPVQTSKAMKSLDSAGQTAVQPSLIPGKPGGSPGGPPPPDERFFNDPRNLRTIITGTGDGYRSPELPSRLDTHSPLHHLPMDRPMLDGGPTGLSPSEILTERLRTPFSVPQPVATNPPDDSGLGMEYGYGQPPPLSNSSVFPAELMVYNDLVMDIGTAQYLGLEMIDQTTPPLVNLSMMTGDGGGISGTGSSANGYQWQGVPHHVPHEPPQTKSSFGYPQPGQPSYGVGYISAQQTGTDFEGQWPPGGITDFE